LKRSAAAKRELKEKIVHFILFCCGCISIITTVGIVLVLGIEAFGFFQIVPLWDFFTDTQWTPLFSEKHFGILPLVCGTLLTSIIALLIALPFGVLVAVFLSEFASETARRILRPLIEILAGIPTVIYGYFALSFITPLLTYFLPDLSGFNALSPGIVMGFMILPMVASLSEDALYSVPQSLKEGAYALGCNRLQMMFKVLIPAAFSGITAAFILAMSRAIGETMIVAIAAGQQPILTMNPLSAVETMTAYIVQISLGDTPHGTLEYKTIFAVGLSLFLMTLVLNTVSFMIRKKVQWK
jgi:phosphate transport system permease protein